MHQPSLFESFERRVLFSGAGQDVELPGQVSAVALQSPMQAMVVVQFEAETQSLSTTSKNTYLSAKIIGGAPTVGGTVRFYSGEVLIGSAVVRSSGQADLSLFLPVTQHQLRAEYSGDEAHAPAASPVVHYEAPPLYASKGKTYRGEDGAVYVDYSDRDIVPTGYIYFMDGPSAYHGRYFARAPLVNGVARLDTLVGYDPNYYLAYGYGGDENYRIDLNRLGMLPVPLLESRPATAQLILPAEPIQAGHTARYTLALRDPDLKPGEWFGGRFDIEVNGEFVTSARVGTTGWAVFELTLPEGEHAIRAVFNRLDGGPAGSREDSPFHASGATATAVVSVPSAVTPADQPEALVANDGTPGEQQVMGVSVKAEPQLNTYNSRFTATIDAPGAVGGTVSFYADGQLIGTVPVGQNNQAVFTGMLPGGMHTIRAEYSGDATYATATSAHVTYQAYKLTIGVGSAKITREADGSVRLDFTGKEYPPTGVIYFADGPVANAQTAFAIVPIVDGVAVLRVAPPNNPVYIAYGYSGDDYYQPQFNRIDVVPMPIIDHRPVTVTITPPAEGFTAGEKTSVEFWITDPQLQAGEWYGGSVTIEIDGRVIATPGVGSNGRAVASLTLLPGSHEIRATYNRVPASTVYSVDPFHASGAPAAIAVEVAGSLQPGAYALTLGYSVGPQWEAIASADFNGDGTPDLLFRHLDSGKAYLWLLKGHQVAAQGGVAASAGWRAAGASDFDGDGKADILWANDAAGKQAIWQMNGTVIRGFTMLNHAPASPVWRLESVMDLDDDGDDDLLWRNVNTDATFAWFLQGTCVVGGSAL